MGKTVVKDEDRDKEASAVSREEGSSRADKNSLDKDPEAEDKDVVDKEAVRAKAASDQTDSSQEARTSPVKLVKEMKAEDRGVVDKDKAASDPMDSPQGDKNFLVRVVKVDVADPVVVEEDKVEVVKEPAAGKVVKTDKFKDKKPGAESDLSNLCYMYSSIKFQTFSPVRSFLCRNSSFASIVSIISLVCKNTPPPALFSPLYSRK